MLLKSPGNSFAYLCKPSLISGVFCQVTPFWSSVKFTNYILLAFIACGEYYKDYDHVMGTLGIGHFSVKQWIQVIEWIAPEVEN